MAGKGQPYFPSVTGMTKDANGLNQKNGRRRETKGKKKCVGAPHPQHYRMKHSQPHDLGKLPPGEEMILV